MYVKKTLYVAVYTYVYICMYIQLCVCSLYVAARETWCLCRERLYMYVSEMLYVAMYTHVYMCIYKNNLPRHTHMVMSMAREISYAWEKLRRCVNEFYTWQRATWFVCRERRYMYVRKTWYVAHTAIHCNTLQYTATHCNTLQHTLQHTTCSKDMVCSYVYTRIYVYI